MTTKLKIQAVCENCAGDGSLPANVPYVMTRARRVICMNCSRDLGAREHFDREMTVPVFLGGEVLELVQCCGYRLRDFEGDEIRGTMTFNLRSDANATCEIDWQPLKDPMKAGSTDPELENASTVELNSDKVSALPKMMQEAVKIWTRLRLAVIEGTVHRRPGRAQLRFRGYPVLASEPAQRMGILRVQLKWSEPYR